MGYFSNGSEGDAYQEQWCYRCVHDANNDCPVWGAHLAFNYEQLRDSKDQHGPMRQLLGMLIPERKDHLGNEQCKLFIEI